MISPNSQQVRNSFETNLPSGWEWRRVRHVGQVLIGLTFSPDDVCSADDGILVLRSSNVQRGRIELGDCVFVNCGVPSRIRTRENDILICSRNGSRALVGKCALIPKEATGQTFGAFMSVFRSAHNHFMFWVFSSHLFESQAGSFLTATINQLTTGNLNGIRVPLPPPNVQRTIAAYLDRETAKIDTLIAKKRELIEKLKEQRSALISRVVTRGLPHDAASTAGLEPNPPMKDSGVDWLGKVPEQWSVKRLRFITTMIRSGKTPSGGAETYVEAGIPLLRSQNVQMGYLEITDVAFISEEVDRELGTSRAWPNDVLLNITGASIGRCAIVPEHLHRANVNQHVCVIRPTRTLLCAEYLSLFLSSKMIQWLISASENGTSREGLNFGQIGNFWIPLPSMREQRAICTFLKARQLGLERLTECAESAIARLMEYRSALITQAVTGQIDVPAIP